MEPMRSFLSDAQALLGMPFYRLTDEVVVHGEDYFNAYLNFQRNRKTYIGTW
jgi:hypothetical protein